MWKRNNKDSKINQQYYIQEGNKTVCKVVLRGVVNYELWLAGEFVKRGSSFDEVRRSEYDKAAIDFRERKVKQDY